MPGLTSQRDSHDIIGRNVAPGITGVAPARHADTLRAAGRRDTGHDMPSFGAQLNPTSSRLGHCRGLEQRYAICQYRRQVPAATSANLSWIVAAGPMTSIMMPSPRNTRLCESRTAAIQ